MRGRIIFAVTMIVAILAMNLIVMAASQTNDVGAESTPWYEAAWTAVSDAATFCADTVVDAACAVGTGAKHVAGSYLLRYADIHGHIVAWAQETGTELIE